MTLFGDITTNNALRIAKKYYVRLHYKGRAHRLTHSVDRFSQIVSLIPKLLVVIVLPLHTETKSRGIQDVNKRLHHKWIVGLGRSDFQTTKNVTCTIRIERLNHDSHLYT